MFSGASLPSGRDAFFSSRLACYNDCILVLSEMGESQVLIIAEQEQFDEADRWINYGLLLHIDKSDALSDDGILGE